MGPKTILDMLEELVGRRCRIETTDGTIQHETIHSVGHRTVKWSGGLDGEVGYPVTLYFNEGESEGVDLGILQSIELDE